ncbi:MAG: hypothetical protein JNK21_07100 [Rhodospirillaceae bacterium]|nr:hypothetical protein [Rhodospirillaceae bacterium]
MPVWGTLKQVLSLCWAGRATALKFGAVPIVVNVVLVVFFTEVAPQSFTEYARSWAISLVSILAFAPFCVAWYRAILFGPDAVAARSVFTVTLLELRFFAWMLLISVMTALVSAILVFVGVALVVLISVISEVAGVIAGIVLTIAGLAILLMTLSRWSIGLAMVATGGKMDLQRAWMAAKPYGWAMAGVQMIIFLAVAVIAGALLAGTLPDFIEAVRTKTAAPERTQIIVQLVGTIAGALTLWLTTTMYALVYRMAIPAETAEAPPSLPEQDG